MYVGSNKQGGEASQILVDLANPGIYLTLKTTRYRGVYQWSKSSTYKQIGSKSRPVTKVVNGESLTGWEAQDLFGLQSEANQVMVTTNFFIVKASSVSTNPAVNGIIGLAPASNDTSSYVEELYQGGHIDSQVISFFFTDGNE